MRRREQTSRKATKADTNQRTRKSVLRKLAAESLDSPYGNTSRDVMRQAASFGITNSEWLRERLLFKEGLLRAEPITIELTVRESSSDVGSGNKRLPSRRKAKRTTRQKGDAEFGMFRMMQMVSSAALLGRLAFEHVKSALGR